MSLVAVRSALPVVSSDPAKTTKPTLTPELRHKLTPHHPTDRLRGWIVTAAVAAIAAALRLIGLVHPRGLVFDEIYYAQHARQMLDHGVEWNPEVAEGAYVAHPPLGKWCIAVGEWLFGYNEFGWRISSVVAGVISVVILVRLTRRLTGSTLLGGVAGLLMSIDGLHLVLSRMALLDIFLMVFLLAAFYCVVRDRESRRARWLAALDNGLDVRRGRPPLAIPWWRISAGVMCGAALGVKWSALWYILIFLILIIIWEWRLRRDIGVPHPLRDTALDEAGWVFTMLAAVAVTYLATWTGWFLNDEGSFRHHLADEGRSEPPVIGALYNWFQYHLDVLNFHNNLGSPHDYQSWPYQWLLDARPVVFFWSKDVECGTGDCAAEVLLLGTPVLWWAFIPSLIALACWGLVNRDWRAGAVLAGVAAGIVPWAFYPDRTMFYFYALPAEPFLILAVTFTLGMILGPRRASAERRLTGALVTCGFITIVVLCFAYFYPLYTGTPIPYDEWQSRMWLDSRWI